MILNKVNVFTKERRLLGDMEPIIEEKEAIEGKEQGAPSQTNLTSFPTHKHIRSVVFFEKEKISIRMIKRARKLEKKNMKEAEGLRLDRLRVIKAQNQTRIDNESLFNREMKLWQDKKELSKERKMFNAMMVEGRNELRQGGAKGTKVAATQQQDVGAAGFSWNFPLNFNCVQLCFAAAFLCLFFLVSFLVLMIILNLIPGFDNFFE